MIKSNSQAGQDIFAYYINNYNNNGFFLDLGCNEPFAGNNTALLESKGWSGILIDYNLNLVNMCRNQRRNTVLLADLKNENLSSILDNNQAPNIIDYISMDLDFDIALDSIKTFDFTKRKIKCMTFEHDFYSTKSSMKDESRKFLQSVGLTIVCKDVQVFRGSSFEDWYIDSNLVDKNIYEHILSDNLYYSEIIEKINLK
jgi:hypothetical protein